MSTRSLDLSLPLHNRNHSFNDILPFGKDLSSKVDVNDLHNYEAIGQRLIKDKLLLSALELYAELAEAGHEILCLKQFFSNPGNFEKTARDEKSRSLVRSSSQVTLDSLDYAPPSEDGDRTGEDKVAVLEFELRKARETINSLRANLTQQVEQEKASLHSDSESESSQTNSKWFQSLITSNNPEPMKAYEQRAINFLVHEYLLTHGYRLTSITFADENAEQDFENWDDVGLNMERPVDLLTMFRYAHRFRRALQCVPTENVETQTEETIQEDEGDLTMQIGGAVEETSSVNDTPSVTPVSLKTVRTNPFLNIENDNIPQATSPVPNAEEFYAPAEFLQAKKASVSKSPSLENISSSTFAAPVATQTTPLQTTARALKEELQQGVEDVYQKLNQFFSKPQFSLQSNVKENSTASQLSGFFSKKSRSDLVFPFQ